MESSNEQSTSEPELGAFRWARICVFCLVVNALPTSGVAVGQLQFAVFEPESYQALGIISSLTSLCASLAFGGGFNRRRLLVTIAGAMLMAAAVGLAPLPFIFAVDHRADTEKFDLWSSPGALGVGASVLGSVATMFTVLPVDTLVTSASGGESKDQSSTALAFFLSWYSLGATVGGLISAPILQAIGLDGHSWQALPAWVVTTAFLKLFVLVLLPLLPRLSSDTEQPALLLPEQEDSGLPQARSDADSATQLGVCTAADLHG